MKVQTDTHGEAEHPLKIDGVPGFFGIAPGRVVVDMDFVRRFSVLLPNRVAQNIIQKLGLVGHFSGRPMGVHEVLPVGVPQNIKAVPPIHKKISCFECRGQNDFEIGLAGLTVAPGYGHFMFNRFLKDHRDFQRVGGKIYHRDSGKNGCQNIGQVRMAPRISLSIEAVQARSIFKIVGYTRRQEVDEDGLSIRVPLSEGPDVLHEMLDLAFKIEICGRGLE